MRRLVGRRVSSRPAVLVGYRRTLDPKIGYPIVRPLPGSSVGGKLLEGVDGEAFAALDAYEGAQYRRVLVRVRTSDGRAAVAYVYSPRLRTRPARSRRGSRSRRTTD